MYIYKYSAIKMTESDNHEIREQINSLTIHGWSNIATAKVWYSRCFWFMFCVLAASLVSRTSIKSYYRYTAYDVYEKIEFKQNKRLAFPAITFCHTDFYHPETYLDIKPPMFQHFPRHCNHTDRSHFKNDINMYIFRIFCKVFISTFDGKSSALGHFIPFYFNFPNDFTLLPNIYPCTTLNRNSTLIQNYTGESHGINMILYNVDADNSIFGQEVESPLLDRRQGILLAIHDPKQHVPLSEKFLLPAGFHTQIFLTKNVIHRLPSPFPSGCVEAHSDNSSIFPGKNTQNMCLISCLYRGIKNICGGVIPDMRVFFKPSEYENARNTSYSDLLRCMAREFDSFDVKKCDCKPHCYEESYTITTNRSPWPSKRQASTLSKLVNRLEGLKNRTRTLAELRDRLLKVTISFQTFTETINDEIAMYDVVSVISDIGGQMGLFLGASFISLIEIISLLMTYIKGKILRKRNVSSTSEVTEVSVRKWFEPRSMAVGGGWCTLSPRNLHMKLF